MEVKRDSVFIREMSDEEWYLVDTLAKIQGLSRERLVKRACMEYLKRHEDEVNKELEKHKDEVNKGFEMLQVILKGDE